MRERKRFKSFITREKGEIQGKIISSRRQRRTIFGRSLSKIHFYRQTMQSTWPWRGRWTYPLRSMDTGSKDTPVIFGDNRLHDLTKSAITKHRPNKYFCCHCDVSLSRASLTRKMLGKNLEYGHLDLIYYCEAFFINCEPHLVYHWKTSDAALSMSTVLSYFNKLWMKLFSDLWILFLEFKLTVILIFFIKLEELTILRFASSLEIFLRLCLRYHALQAKLFDFKKFNLLSVKRTLKSVLKRMIYTRNK